MSFLWGIRTGVAIGVSTRYMTLHETADLKGSQQLGMLAGQNSIKRSEIREEGQERSQMYRQRWGHRLGK
jgi:chromosome condensin MukBEF complex kleisin-like MukF subunit